MLHWYSPFPLPEPVLAQLDQAGLQRLQEPSGEVEEPVLLLYDTPDRLLEGTDLGAAALVQGYRALLELPLSFPRLALWRLNGVDIVRPDHLQNALSGTPPAEGTEPALPPEPNPLTALVTIALCRIVPGLLDAYLDLELQAQLLGGEPDVAYLRRLQGECTAEELLSAWRTPADLTLELERVREQERVKESALNEAREEAELTLLQLHQVQEELEQIFLADREKQQDLEEKGKEISELRERLEGKGQEVAELREQLEGKGQEVAELREQLEGKGQEVAELQTDLREMEVALTDAREEAELTLLQLHQVQEELEHYFLLSRGQQALLQRHEELDQRSERLLVSLRRGG